MTPKPWLLALACTALVGCTPTWLVLEQAGDDAPPVDAQLLALNQKHHDRLAQLAGQITALHYFARQDLHVNWKYVTFTRYKDQPALTVEVNCKGVDSHDTTKVSRCAEVFSNELQPLVRAMASARLLEPNPDYAWVHLGAHYTSQDNSFHHVNAVGQATAQVLSMRSEDADYFLPLALLKGYVDGDVSVQELLEKSTVLIDGEKNLIRT